MKVSITTTTLGLVAACAIGCASTPVPEAQVASTESAVQAAQKSGAKQVPVAQTRLTKAEQELDQAKSLIQKGENDDAGGMLSRAESDAAVASALSREAQQTAATNAAVQRLRATSGAGPMNQPAKQR